MNKFLKIFLPILAGTLAIAYFVCNLVIPEQTAWFIAQVGLVLNYPITIAGVSVTIGGIIAYVIVNFILKTTKFGRKELDNIKKDYNQAKNDISEYKHNLDLELETYKNKYNELQDACENKVAVLINEFNDLQKETLAALKTIPNKKVQAIVCEYEEKFNEREVEIIEKVTNSSEYVDKKIKEIMEKVEEMLNEREETIDSETEAA